MNKALVIPQQNDLETFINFLYDGLEGYVYVAIKEPNHGSDCTEDECKCWEQAFFEYPAQVPAMLQAINHYRNTQEVFIAPALFNAKSSKREHVKVSNVLWTEFDGNTPLDFDIPPSMMVRSSEPGHEHIYWKLDQPLTDINTLEDYNRRICFKYGADNSAWDANQVLRPPYTINHKRNGLPVAILSHQHDLTLHLSIFDSLAPAPEKTVDYSLWEKIDLPSLNDVIYQNKFGPDFKLVFEKSKEEVSDRSASLTNMAFIAAEAGLSDKEIYTIISHLALRWEKFKHHTPANRAKQLISIIEHTRIKYPHTNYADLDQVFIYSPKSLLDTDIKVEWAIPGMLMKNGVMLMSGPGGIGKSQLSMQFMFHLAMGLPFLHYEIDEPQKVGFLSLEMPDLEVKAFLQSMYPQLESVYTPEQIDLLNENMDIIPIGENLPLNTTAGQAIFLKYLEERKWNGVFIDSVGSAILGGLNDQANVQAFTNFNDKVRKRHNCFLWYIHHFRKPGPGQKSTGNAEDNYGDVYLFNRATSNYTLTRIADGVIRIKNPKNRLAPVEPDYKIQREQGLTFSYQGEINEVPDLTKAIKREFKKDADSLPQPSPFKRDGEPE